MIKVIEESRIEVEDMIFKDDYILIMCKKISATIIKTLGEKIGKVGIFYRNGCVLDAVNGIISKVSKTDNMNYRLALYTLQSKQLEGNIDYEVFYDFLKMKNKINAFMRKLHR